MKQTILNLTQHPATPEQKEAGVFDLQGEAKDRLMDLLTFNSPPSREEMVTRATALVNLVIDEMGEEFQEMDSSVMIGGAPFFMSALENALWASQIRPVYAFSTRESVEETLPDGSVRKTNVFKHVGFVQA